MKKLSLLFITFILFAFQSDKPEYLATVEKISDFPIFIFAKPVSEYEEVGKALSFKEMMSLTLDEESTAREKTVKIVDYALERLKKEKISDFDAIILDLDRDKARVIKFKSGVSLEAKVSNCQDIPLYFFSQPTQVYEVVGELEADYSARASRGFMFDKIRSMVKRTLKKLENNEVKAFDAIIINPDNLSEKLIVFKNN